MDTSGGDSGACRVLPTRAVSFSKVVINPPQPVPQMSWKRLSARSALTVFAVGVLVAALSAEPTLAACDSRASPQVDWTGCTKASLHLSGDDLTGARLDNADLSLTNLKNAKLMGASLVKAT